MGEIEEKYEEYLALDAKTKAIGGAVYFRAVDIHMMKIKTRERMLVIFPLEMFAGITSKTLIDENANVYSLGSFVYCSFRGDIPRWYLECREVELIRTEGNNSIGQYFRFVE